MQMLRPLALSDYGNFSLSPFIQAVMTISDDFSNFGIGINKNA